MELIEQHINVFSPVVYSAVIQEKSGFRPPEGWYSFDLNFLAQASGMIILEIPGWKESRGVLIETAYAPRARDAHRESEVGKDPQSPWTARR